MDQGWAESNRAAVQADLARVVRELDGDGDVVEAPFSSPALHRLQQVFRLSTFETRVVLLCAGYAFDAAVATTLGTPLTFARACAKIADPHLDAVSPTRPLRLHRLVHGGDSLHAPLMIDERILLFLLGANTLDERLVAYAFPGDANPGELTPPHARVARRLAGSLRGLVQVVGARPATRRALVQAAARQATLDVLRIPAHALALAPRELDTLARVYDREVLLGNVVAMIEIGDDDGPEVLRGVNAFVDATTGAVILAAAQPTSTTRTSTLVVEVPSLDAGERLAVWTERFDGQIDNRELARIAHQFRLEPSEIAELSRTEPTELWSACLERARPRLDDLARRITPTAGWNDLVLPESAVSPLRDIVEQLAHRHDVHERWGFARGEGRGQAITALFSGPSGTGKTLAAEVIAREVKLDLYHVDLSVVVDKYIGETEKRLRRIFDAAEAGGAILLFDEADALFGKRGEIQRGTDRWANLEVSYLLQRMESYRGLAILTTNARDALDSAFLRRLRFVVPFPYPDVAQRVEIWRRAFPPDAPTIGLDAERLATLRLTGANIKSIALSSAFHAAGEGAPIGMRHVLRAARAEFAKLEQPFPERDVQRWQI
ncbi:MAG: ATP-binding protein [Kofleriaceae bacterium]